MRQLTRYTLRNRLAFPTRPITPLPEGLGDDAPALPAYAASVRSPLIDLAPQQLMVHAGFTTIPGDTETPTVPTGSQQGAFLLARFDDNAIGQEFVCFGYEMSQLPGNTDGSDQWGSGNAQQIFWGLDYISAKHTGRTALLVIAKNTQVRPGAWNVTNQFSGLPGMGTPPNFGRTTPYSHAGNVLAFSPFPPGSMSDTLPEERVKIREFSPSVERFNSGDTLDVLLVVAGSSVILSAVGSGSQFSGYASVSLKLGPVQSQTPFRV